MCIPEFGKVKVLVGEGELAEELTTLNNLAKTLRAKRMSSGAIAFDKVEVRFLLDEKGECAIYRLY